MGQKCFISSKHLQLLLKQMCSWSSLRGANVVWEWCPFGTGLYVGHQNCYWTKTWVCSPMHSKGNPVTLGSDEGKCSIYFKTPYKVSRTINAQEPELPNEFQQKPRWGRKCPRVCDQLMHSSLIGWWWGNRVMSKGLTFSILREQQVWGLCIHGHQVANVFHFAAVLTPVKQFKKFSSDIITFQRGAKAEDIGERCIPRRPDMVLHGYNLSHTIYALL